MRPAHRVVIVGFRPAELVEPRHQEFGRLDGGSPVEVDHLVERAVERAFGRRAVVAEDVIDQRVVEQVELFQIVQQASDMVVGVLQESRVDFHLAAQHRLESFRHVVPGRDLFMALGELAIFRDDAQLLLPRKGLFAELVPARRRTGPCTCPPTPSGRGAARGSRPARSR